MFTRIYVGGTSPVTREQLQMMFNDAYILLTGSRALVEQGFITPEAYAACVQNVVNNLTLFIDDYTQTTEKKL